MVRHFLKNLFVGVVHLNLPLCLILFVFIPLYFCIFFKVSASKELFIYLFYFFFFASPFKDREIIIKINLKKKLTAIDNQRHRDH